MIFYRTGKLAYVSKRIWDQYDEQYSIQRRVDEFKKLAMTRATDFNTAFKDYQVYDQIGDAWTALMSVPNNAIQLDEQYGVTSWLGEISKQTASMIGSAVSSFADQINNSFDPKYSNRNKSKKSQAKRGLLGSVHSLIIGSQNHQMKHLDKINPWGTPFNPYKHDGYKFFVKKKEKQNSANIVDKILKVFSLKRTNKDLGRKPFILF